MTRSSCCFMLFLLLALLTPWQLCAQGPATGTPPFGSFGGGPDVINLANLNMHYDIPIFSKPGRGTDFTYDLTYDSSIWNPVTANGSTTWVPVANLGWASVTQPTTGFIAAGTTNYSVQSTYCSGVDAYTYVYTWTYGGWVYIDSLGAAHPFSGTATTIET